MKKIPFLLTMLTAGLLTSAGCSSSSSSSMPTQATPTVTVDLTGTWGETVGTLVMRLQQNGTTVTGTSSFSDRNSVFGTYDASGTVTGTISGSTLTMDETYTVVPTSPTAPTGCIETVRSTWTIESSSKLDGPFSQTDTCSGTVVFTKAGTATIVKQ